MHTNQICALYCRLSRDDEDANGDSNSIANQKSRLLQFAKEKGFNNPTFFVDDGVSGSTFQRPGFQEMLREVEAGNIGQVIVKDMSRFGRNYLQVGMYTEMTFPQFGVRFIAIDDNVDSEHGTENDLTPFRNVFNEWFCRDTSKKIRAAAHARAKAGLPGSKIPYGYVSSSDGQWVIHDESAEITREIFQRIIGGEGTGTISADLNRRGVPSPSTLRRMLKGKPPANPPSYWSSGSIMGMLENKAYIGTLVTHKNTTVSYKNKKRIIRPEDEWCVTPNRHEAIIDIETFETVQRLSQHRRKRTVFGDVGSLNGLMFCADCNATMSLARSISAKYEYYICSNYRQSSFLRTCTRHSIHKKDIERLVLEDLRVVVEFAKTREAEFAQLIRSANDKETERTTKVKRREFAKAEERIAELDVIIQKLYEDNVTQKLSDDRFAKLLANYEAEQNVLLQKTSELKTELAVIQEQTDSIDRFIALTRRYSEVQELTPEIARSYIDKIVISERAATYSEDGRKKIKTQNVDIFYMYIGKLLKE